MKEASLRGGNIVNTTTPIVEQIDPRALLVDLNVSGRNAIDKELLASIRDLGVLQPVIGYRTAGGDVRVRYGHRRTLHAIHAGLATIPVIVAADEATDNSAAVERLLGQYAENSYREGLTTLQQASIVTDLLGLGVKAAAIQRRMPGLPRNGVRALQAITASPAATAAAAEHPFTLDQLAAIAEFDGDDQAVSLLTEAARQGDGRFRYRLQEQRDARKERQLITARRAELEAAGVTMLDMSPGWEVGLANLTDGAGNEITPETHASCPGHAATIEYRSWSAEPWDIRFYCTDPGANGHPQRQAAPAESPVSAEDRARQRREVVANNKTWRTAATVRRQFLQNLLARKKAPAGALRFVLEALVDGGPSLRRQMERGHDVSRGLLGLAESENRWGADRVAPLTDALMHASDDRALVLGLGLILAAFEDATHPDMWRSPGSHSDTAAYFSQLQTWGHALCEMEQQIVDACETAEAQRAAALTADNADAAEREEPAVSTAA
jgi:ParB family transcriptional regulator, chromosome partitioning protein